MYITKYSFCEVCIQFGHFCMEKKYTAPFHMCKLLAKIVFFNLYLHYAHTCIHTHLHACE